jgi:iron complex outermembrane receptor protein
VNNKFQWGIMNYRREILLSASALALLVAMPRPGHAEDATAPAASPSVPQVAEAGAIEEVTVTARRRTENAQDTPVAVTAFSSEAMTEKGIHEIEDLDTQVPGFRFAQEGGKNTDDVILRGLSRIPLGIGIPAVVTYFADVPVPGIASNVPTYDLENIQVLKGPQGTLFGRNTLGGAVVMTPQSPGDTYGGYLDFRVGNLGREAVEGAVNIPIVADKLELRLSGLLEQGDGYVKNLSGGPDMSNTKEGSYRVSLLVAPTDYIRDTLIYDYTITPEVAAGLYLQKANPGIFGALFTPSFGPVLAQAIGNSLDSQIASYVTRQRAAGPFSAFTDLPDGGQAFSREWGISNDLRIDIGDNIQLRNIAGLRTVFNQETIDTGGVETLGLPLPGVGTLPFTLFDASQVNNQQFFTDEQQISGKAFNDRLSWIVGGFYNNDYSNGPAGSQFTAFSVGGVAAPAVTALVKDTNYALYGQLGYDMSDWLLQGLSLNLGYRYSWDEVSACGGTVGTTYADSDACEAAAAQHIPGGPGDISTSGSEPSWTVGLDYKASDSQFFYITSRRGYRGVNVNTPLFSSVYTTGGASPLCFGGTCPDLRPFQTTKPEKLTDVEIGSKTDFNVGGMVGRFDIDGYWSQYKGALQFINTQTIVPNIAPDSPTNGSVGVNAADETIYGIELGATLKPVPDLTLSLNGAYTSSQVDAIYSPSASLVLSKSQITLPTPKLAGSAAARWILPVQPFNGNLVFNADIYSTGRFGVQDGVSFGGYSVTNARIDLLGVGGTNLDVGFYVKNMFNRVYLLAPCVELPTFPVSTGYLGEPQTFGFEARYTFDVPQAPEAAEPVAVPLPPAPVAPPPAPLPEAARSFQVFFDFDKSDITAAAAKVIQAAADAVKAGHVVQITVTGHTDTVGSASYNQGLSERRAAAVKTGLVADGVAGGEITTLGVGKTGLLVPTADGVREPQNRRAEIVLQ